MLELRLLHDDDISLVEDWLNKEHVKRWYEIPRLGISNGDWIYELQERKLCRNCESVVNLYSITHIS